MNLFVLLKIAVFFVYPEILKIMFGKKFLLLALLPFLFFPAADAQNYKNKLYLDYIDKYKDEAVNQQKRYKIPASITLAQGLLESGAGRSELARKSNNHFGIKCHTVWRGDKVYHDDDEKGECFRKYDDPMESYEDHSLFLTTRARYAPLFDLKITDYRGWAVGLKKCGYATDKAYASKLIDIIETYELYKYDVVKEGRKKEKSKEHEVLPHTPYISSGLLYVEAREGETLLDIAKEFKIKVKKLAAYNEIPREYPLYDGMVIYLQEKNKYADPKFKEHTVAAGESMYSISQRYGMKLASLYKLNKKRGDYVPVEGDVLKVNK